MCTPTATRASSESPTNKPNEIQPGGRSPPRAAAARSHTIICLCGCAKYHAQSGHAWAGTTRKTGASQPARVHDASERTMREASGQMCTVTEFGAALKRLIA